VDGGGLEGSGVTQVTQFRTTSERKCQMENRMNQMESRMKLPWRDDPEPRLRSVWNTGRTALLISSVHFRWR